MQKFSKNHKLNKAYNEVYDQLLRICDQPEESIREIARYYKEFWKEPDYNLAAYGNLLFYYFDIRCMYLRAGYKAEKWSDNKIWRLYRYQVGYIAKRILETSPITFQCLTF